jgi:hypothetical protein
MKAGLPLTADKTKSAFEYHNLNAGQNPNVKLASWLINPVKMLQQEPK